MQRFFNNECDYLRIDNCKKSNDTIIVFSHIGYPSKKFAMSNVLKEIPATKIYVNCHENSWYQDGIKGITSNIDETLQLLSKILQILQPNKVICTGMSMGAYAALLFGLKLKCDIIIAFTPEIMIGEEYSRSYYLNDLKQYDYRYMQLSNLIRNNEKTQIYSIYGVYDIIDLSFLWLIADVLLEEKLFKAFFVSGDHTVTNSLDACNIMKTVLKKGELVKKDIHPEYLLNQKHEMNELLIYREIHRLQLKKDSESVYNLLKPYNSLKEISQLCLYFGNACIDLKLYEEAKDILHHAIKLDPNSNHLYHSLGIAYHFTNELNEAKIWYEKALEIRPYAVNTRHRIGSIELTLKNYESAETHLKKAVELNPKYTEAYALLGELFLEKEFYNEAGIYYGQAAKYDPNNEEYKENIKIIKSLIRKNKIIKLKKNWKHTPRIFTKKVKTKIKKSI